MKTEEGAGGRSMEWEFEVPLLANRHTIDGLARAILGGAFLVALLVGLLLGVQGEWKLVPRVAVLLLGIGAALFLAGLAVAALLFRGKLRTRYVVDGEGIHMSVVDPVARAGNRGAFWVGLVLGSGAAAGSGLLAMEGERRILRWAGAFRAVPERSTSSIALQNGWRTLLRVYCLPKDFDRAWDAVRGHMARSGTAARCPRSPLPAYLGRTILVIAATIPILAVQGDLGIGLLAPFLLLCFGVATVWFVRPLAWVVLALLAVVAARGAIGALAVRISSLGRGDYRRFETLSGDSWALLMLAIAGMAVLAGIATATLRRRIVPALAADDADAGQA